jgi:drug/metabolite transporter (DMT)-like permease
VHRASTGRVVLLALILGFNFLWIKLAIRGVSPVEVTLSRLVLGSAVLFVVVIAKRGAVPRSVMIWLHIAVAAIFANAVPFLLFAEGEQHVSSSTAGMLNATTPLWTVVIALATRHQQATSLRQVGGLAVGFVGTMLIFQPWKSSGLASVGAVDCLAASASYGISYVYMDRFLVRRGVNPVTLSACQLLSASAWLAIALGVTSTPTPRLDATVTVSIVVLGMAGTGIAYVLNYQIITNEGATLSAKLS